MFGHVVLKKCFKKHVSIFFLFKKIYFFISYGSIKIYIYICVFKKQVFEPEAEKQYQTAP